MITLTVLRSVSQRYSHHLQCHLKAESLKYLAATTKSRSQLFCTNANEDDQESNDGTSTNTSDPNWIEAPTLPCFLTQFDAMETFAIWAKRQWFAPKSFKKNSENYVYVIHKHYVPYWHFEATAQSRWHASIAPDAPPSREQTTSCTYSSSQLEMQIIANDKLTSDEGKFLSVPLGPTQFQRMTHHTEDLLPDTVNEAEATDRVRKWLQSTETQRVHDFVTIQERLYKPMIKSDVEHSCRKAYMPCFIIYFNPLIPNPKDKPDAITEVIPNDASYRAIVHGYNGNIQGPKLYSFSQCAKLTLPISMIGIVPIGALLYFPLIHVGTLATTTGLAAAAIMNSPIFSLKVYRLEGHTLDTQQTRLKRQQMEEKEVEDILREAERSWGSHTHRSRPIAREQERAAKESYERYDQYGQAYTSPTGEGQTYDSDGRPIGRRAIRFIELYEILGISPNASTREIQQAFTKMAKQYHPDTLQNATDLEKERNHNKFQKVLLAFQVLKDPERRKKYDTTGATKEDKKRNKKPPPDSRTDNKNTNK